MDLLANLFGKDNVKQLTTTEVSLYPEISKREYERMLATLPMKDLQEMLDEDHGVEVVDRFTGKKIQFDAELAGIIAAKDAEGL